MRFLPIAAIVATLAAAAPALATAIDVGPKVGSVAPPLAAVDASGRARDLASLAGKNGTVLVFFRSARWCPFCQKQLVDLKAAAKPLAERGYGLAAISYDTPAQLSEFAAKTGVGYVLLSDRGSAMIDAYKLRDPQYPADSFAYGVPRPAIFVLDTKGTVRAKLAEEGYRTRPEVTAILSTVDGLR